MTVETSAAPLRQIDEAFLKGVEVAAAGFVTSVAGTRERACVDLEVISDPHVDLPAEGHASEEALVSAFVDRYALLREPFGARPPDLLVVRGGTTIEPAPGGQGLGAEVEEGVWEAALNRLSQPPRTTLSVLADADRAPERLAAVFSVELPGEGGRAAERLAVVAVLAIPETADGRGNPQTGAERLVRILTEGMARGVPLYVVGVNGRAAIDGILPWCQRLRTTLILDGANGGDDVLSISRTVLQRGQGATDVAVVPCAPFKAGTGTPGLTRLRLDVLKGEAAIAFRHDLGSDRSPRPVQVVRRLSSASRVSGSEQRLHGRVSQLVEAALKGGKDRSLVEAFAKRAADTWERTGYAALCDCDEEGGRASGGFVPLEPERYTSYNLLVLLREREGGYDILLSNHSPLRPSTLSDWNTLLMPAFKGARELLEHLRDDVVRQVAERAEDFERAEHAKQFEQAVNLILLHDGRPGEDLWADEIREVATRKIRKISPTTGAVTVYDYHLVTLLPLIDRGNAAPIEDAAGEELDEALRQARRRIVTWLDRLESVRTANGGLGSAGGLPIEALIDGGAGLRWDPQVSLVREPSAEERRRAARAYPGAIWFPLDLRAPHWRCCPSIVSRNADVMTWVDKELSRRRQRDGHFPDQLVLGRYAGGTDRYVVEEDYPFDGAEAAEGVGDLDDENHLPARSTFAALGKVQLNDDLDLFGTAAYTDASFERVWLVRLALDRHRGRPSIGVFPAEAGERYCSAVTERQMLGLLRPVQRYVLRAGLERVEQLEAQLGERDDPWGFVRIRRGGAPRLVSVTPPIIEQLHRDDWDEGGVGLDFVVCDGNHRIVHGVWGRGLGAAIAAVAVVGELPEPYYARPFGRLEWDATAGNELFLTPDLGSKYLARVVDRSALEKTLTAKREKMIARVADRDLYRRYFRDLTKGFGYLGGQGGRFV